MDDDPLLTEEAEPPGRSTDAQGLKNSRTNFFSVSQKPSPPAVRLAKTAGGAVSFRENISSRIFRQLFFPTVSYQSWNDWHWQLQNRITDDARLADLVGLTTLEQLAVANGQSLPLAITPYYAGLLRAGGAGHPPRRTVIPSLEEGLISPEEKADPLDEERDTPVPGIVHRYHDRVLFLVTDYCSTYCRYCTRSRMVGGGSPRPYDVRTWEQGIDYIARRTEIRDVLLSGGDPLTLSDEKLDWLLSRLKAIPHLEILRIGTKAPAVMPQGITKSLTCVL